MNKTIQRHIQKFSKSISCLEICKIVCVKIKQSTIDSVKKLKIKFGITQKFRLNYFEYCKNCVIGFMRTVMVFFTTFFEKFHQK